jgi:hypothetical protein
VEGAGYGREAAVTGDRGSLVLLCHLQPGPRDLRLAAEGLAGRRGRRGGRGEGLIEDRRGDIELEDGLERQERKEARELKRQESREARAGEAGEGRGQRVQKAAKAPLACGCSRLSPPLLSPHRASSRSALSPVHSRPDSRLSEILICPRN